MSNGGLFSLACVVWLVCAQKALPLSFSPDELILTRDIITVMQPLRIATALGEGDGDTSLAFLYLPMWATVKKECLGGQYVCQ